MSLQIPGGNVCSWWEFDFMDDTGACMMQISKTDVDLLEILAGIRPRFVGYLGVSVADGSSFDFPVVYMEVTMHTRVPTYDSAGVAILDENGYPVFQPQMVFDWSPVQCAVGYSASISRLNGPWLRQKMYTATAPNPPASEVVMHMFDKKTAFQGHVPARDGRNTVVPLLGLKPILPAAAGAGVEGAGRAQP